MHAHQSQTLTCGEDAEVQAALSPQRSSNLHSHINTLQAHNVITDLVSAPGSRRSPQLPSCAEVVLLCAHPPEECQHSPPHDCTQDSCSQLQGNHLHKDHNNQVQSTTLTVVGHVDLSTIRLSYTAANVSHASLDQLLSLGSEGTTSATDGHLISDDIMRITTIDGTTGQYTMLQRILIQSTPHQEQIFN